MEQEFASSLLEGAVSEFAKLPGIGRKTALRLVLHLLKQDQGAVRHFGEAVINAREHITYCRVCHNISETQVCPICGNPARDASTICVVENVKDVMSIENTAQHRGLYHVLGGLISPIDGVGPQDIEIDSLAQRVASGEVKEVILALSATVEGDTTCFYIYRRLAQWPQVKITQLARGVSVGNEIEYTDELTLGRSILGPHPVHRQFHTAITPISTMADNYLEYAREAYEKRIAKKRQAVLTRQRKFLEQYRKQQQLKKQQNQQE